MFREIGTDNLLTIEEIIEIVGNSFLGLTTSTKPILVGGKSKNPMFGLIEKFTTLGGQCFSNTNKNGYEEKKLKENPDFVLKERKWGSRIPNTAFVENKGKKYLEIIIQSVSKVDFELSGKHIPKDDIQGLPVREERNVEIVTYGFDSILEIRTNGKEFVRV